jgi:hypothetical protein
VFGDIWLEVVGCVHLAQDRVQLCAFERTVMNRRVQKRR